MRLLLTSDAFPKSSEHLRKLFFELAELDAKDVNVAFIPTASEPEKDRAFSKQNRAELVDMGIPEENIVDVNLDHKLTLDELRDFNVVYVDGGNTFYLLQKVRESGFDAVIAEYLKQDLGLFVGGSAGSLIMCPDISIAEPWDRRELADIEDTTGLCYTKNVWTPHYTDAEKEIVDEYREKLKYPVKELRDSEAVIVTDDAEKLITR